MLFTGLCASSASVILPLLQEHYDLSYDFSGLLLAFLSAGNLAAALLCGFLPRFLGVRRTVLLLAFVLPAASRFRSLTLMSVASLVTYLLMLMSSDGLPALITLFLFGLSISGAYPTVIATANRSMSNASVGVLLPVGGIGAILMPYITGAVAEYTGIRGGMMCSAAALVIMIVFSILMKRSETDAPAGQV